MELLNQIILMLFPTFCTIVVGVMCYMGYRIKKVFEEKIQDETAKQVVGDVVKFVEQVYTDIHGQDKLNEAMKKCSELLEEKGIFITETQLHTLIESAVYGLNQGLNKEEEVVDKKLLRG